MYVMYIGMHIVHICVLLDAGFGSSDVQLVDESNLVPASQHTKSSPGSSDHTCK